MNVPNPTLRDQMNLTADALSKNYNHIEHSEAQRGAQRVIDAGSPWTRFKTWCKKTFHKDA